MVRTRHQRIALSLGGMVLVAALAACSGGGGGGETSAPSEAATSEGGATGEASGGGSADFSGVTLEVEATWSGAEQENFQAVLDKFTADTGAKVNYTSFGDNGATVIGTQVEGGNRKSLRSFGFDDIGTVGADFAGEVGAQHGLLSPYPVHQLGLIGESCTGEDAGLHRPAAAQMPHHGASVDAGDPHNVLADQLVVERAGGAPVGGAR